MVRRLSIQLMILFCFLVAWSFVLVVPSSAQDSANLGIFNATADWGLEPEFPPMRKQNKVPGRVEVKQTEQGIVYDLYGNGDDIWNDTDEGFYAYTTRSGSWSLSAKVHWIDQGRDPSEPPSNHPDAGINIRNNGRLTNSTSYRFYVRAMPGNLENGTCSMGIREKPGYRMYGINTRKDGVVVSDPGDGIYFRVTRFAPENYFCSEWSYDGLIWNFDHTMSLDMGDEVAYGISITNVSDNDLLACARFSDVKLEPVEIMAIRRFPRGVFKKGESFDVALEIMNESPHAQEITIEEILPEAWSANTVSHGGVVHGATITWSMMAESGSTLLTYRAFNNEETDEDFVVSGKINQFTIVGEDRAKFMLTGMRGVSTSIWRYWKQSDGLDFLNKRNINVNAKGVVITEKKTGEFARIDGYNVTTIPFKKELYSLENPLGQILPVESASGQIWAASYVAAVTPQVFIFKDLRQYKDDRWVSYQLDGILPTTQSFCIIPGATDQVYLQLNDRIVKFDARTQECHTVRNATALARWYLVRDINSQGSDESTWLFEHDKLVKMTIPNASNNLQEAQWEEFPYDPELNIKEIWLPRGDAKVGITFNYVRGVREWLLGHFDGQSWSKIKNLNTDNGFGLVDQNGLLWETDLLGKYLKQFDLNNNESLVRDEFLTSITTDIAADPVAGFWVASKKGVAKSSPPLWGMLPEVAKLDKPVQSIYEDQQGRIWFVSDDRLLCLGLDQKWKIYLYPESRIPNLTYEMQFTHDRLLIGAIKNQGFLFFNPVDEKFEQERHQYTNLVFYNINNKNIFWKTVLTTTSGKSEWLVIRNDGEGDKVVLKIETGIGNPDVLWEEDNGDFWLSLYDEIRLYHGNEYQSFSDDDGFTIKSARCMIDIGDGKKWCGQNDLLEYDGQSWSLVRSGFGKIHQFLKSSDGSIWIASEVGLWRRKPDGTWLHFETDEGLPSNIVKSIFEDSQKRIWAGTLFGLACYHPEADLNHPETIIKEDEYVDEIVQGTEMRIGFTGMDCWKYTEVERLLYSTRLDDGAWTPFKSATVFSATNLASGIHSLNVRAMDRKGNIDPTPAEFTFTVLLPWYKEPVVLLIIFFSSLLTIIFAAYAVNRHLRLQVANKSLNKFNTDLQEANAQLIQLDQMKTQFVSQASHDLRTPLTAIKGSLDNLLMGIAGALTEKQQKVMLRATTSVDRLTNLINDVLDLNRIETGRIVLEKSDIPFKALVENIVNENRPAAEQKNIQLTFNASDGDYTLNIDGSKIERVVGELVSNAIKYTPDNGNVDVVLSFSDNIVSLSVKDSGIGMTPEECGKIWERFYRTSASKNFAKGSGLGLSIAKELVELHDGTIELISVQGNGSTFTLSLPLKNI